MHCYSIRTCLKNRVGRSYHQGQSEPAQQYLNARISWEAKRPIKIEILNSIDFEKLARTENKEDSYHKLFGLEVAQNLLFA